MQHDQTVEWLGIQDAAKRLGLSVDTVRRKVKRGELPGRQAPRPQGFTWEVYVGDDQVKSAPTQQDLGGQDVGELVTLVRDLTTQNVQLAGRVGWLESQLQQAQERIALLEAPAQTISTDVEEKAPQNATPRVWWRFWRRTPSTSSTG